jgi:hypothetical protein
LQRAVHGPRIANLQPFWIASKRPTKNPKALAMAGLIAGAAVDNLFADVGENHGVTAAKSSAYRAPQQPSRLWRAPILRARVYSAIST